MTILNMTPCGFWLSPEIACGFHPFSNEIGVLFHKVLKITENKTRNTMIQINNSFDFISLSRA